MDKKIEDKMPMDKKGLYVMLAGLGLMVLGYILMSGGGVTDPQVFNYDMFSFRRIVLAPLLLIAGIVTIVVSIIRLSKEKNK